MCSIITKCLNIHIEVEPRYDIFEGDSKLFGEQLYT